MQPGDHIEVYKLDTQGTVVANYATELSELLPNGVRLSARWTRPTLKLGYTTFETGDYFSEWFFTDRWYNIFAVASPDGQRKGWYCNVAEPARLHEHSVYSCDLLLDLWVDTDFRVTVLDEDEFATDQFLSPEARRHALRALDQLRSQVERRLPPFDFT